MAETYKKMKYMKCIIPEDVYDMFVKKIKSEGWTIQEALNRLVYYYAHDRFDITRKK